MKRAGATQQKLEIESEIYFVRSKSIMRSKILLLTAQELTSKFVFNFVFTFRSHYLFRLPFLLVA